MTSTNGKPRQPSETEVDAMLQQIQEEGTEDAWVEEGSATPLTVGQQEFLNAIPNYLDVYNMQEEVAEWVAANFPDAQPWEPLLGVSEEVGELHHAFLKNHQNIRGDTEKHELDMKDALGDAFIYMLHFCVLMGWSLEDCIVDTWAGVRKRNWTENRETGDAGDTEGT